MKKLHRKQDHSYTRQNKDFEVVEMFPLQFRPGFAGERTAVSGLIKKRITVTAAAAAAAGSCRVNVAPE